MKIKNRQLIEQKIFSYFTSSFMVGLLLLSIITVYLPIKLLLSDNYLIRHENLSLYLSVFVLLMFLVVSDNYRKKFPLSAVVMYSFIPYLMIGGINYMVINSVAMSITICILIVYMGILVYVLIKQHRIKSQSILYYTKFLFVQFIKVFCLSCLIWTVLLSIHTYQTTKIVLHKEYCESEPKLNLIDNQTLLNRFNDDDFFDLTIDEQRSILILFLAVEQEYLGIKDVDLEIVYSDSSYRGRYLPSKRAVIINLQNRKHVRSILVTLAHECYHVYQRDVDDYLIGVNVDTNLMFLRDLKYWRSEKVNFQYTYSDGEGRKRFDEYLFSSTEQTARAYAEERAAYYIEYLK